MYELIDFLKYEGEGNKDWSHIDYDEDLELKNYLILSSQIS